MLIGIRIVVYAISFSLAACSGVKEVPSANSSAIDTVTDAIYADFSIDSYRLVVKGIAGKCLISYSNLIKINEVHTIDTNVESPCQFVRTGLNLERPQSYTYNHGTSRRTVLLIVGGPAHPLAKDQFFPNGCGTRLVKVRIFSDRVDTEELTGYYSVNGTDTVQGPFCAGSMDEKTFAT